MKIIYRLTALIIAFSLLFVTTSAQAECHWYIKRQEGKAPIFPREAETVRKYGGYFIDEKADEDNKILYLTFDVGYENGNVERILDVLKKESVPAAFFLLDNIILKNKDLVTRMAEEGHLVCNHTKNLKNLSFKSKEEIKADLCALEEIYKAETGREMSKYFRFPEGKYSIEALKTVNELGYKTIFWSFAYEDWDNLRQPDCEWAINKVLKNTHSGAVMLFHPTSKTNAEIFEELIIEWRKMGYSFGSLDKLTEGG